MIFDIPYEYEITYARKRSSKPKQARVRSSTAINVATAKGVEHAVSIRVGNDSDHWVTSEGGLYRLDALTVEERLAGPGFVAPLPQVSPTALHEDDIGAVLQATKVLASDQEHAETRAGAQAAALRLHNGKLLYPSKGPVLCIHPVPTPGRAQQRDYLIVPVQGYEIEPGSYPGRSFAARDLLAAVEFCSAMGYEVVEQPTVSIRNGDLVMTDLGGRPLVDAAARIFDATQLNRDLSNLPYHYVEGYIRYHSPGFDRDVPSDELVQVLLEVVRNPGRTDYFNDVRKRFLDAVDDVHCALWQHLGCSIHEVVDPDVPNGSFTMAPSGPWR